ncbi:MAG: monofunctional biosynthetic peptidoglycan transglycosylase [Vicinamibacterales bacterium]
MARLSSLVRKFVRAAIWLLAIWLVVTMGSVLALRWYRPPTSAVMWLEPGPIGAIDYRWVDRSRISVNAAHAVIAAEDQKFLEHWGFDVDQINDAIETYRDGGRLRGASTITQQVAKNLFLWNGGGFVRKALEGYFAVIIEAFWPKERILEMYLNVAEFGPRIFGIEAAAERTFGTSASRLTRPQAALLAAVLPNPKRLLAANPSEYVRMRQAEISDQMRVVEDRGRARLRW